MATHLSSIIIVGASVGLLLLVYICYDVSTRHSLNLLTSRNTQRPASIYRPHRSIDCAPLFTTKLAGAHDAFSLRSIARERPRDPSTARTPLTRHWLQLTILSVIGMILRRIHLSFSKSTRLSTMWCVAPMSTFEEWNPGVPKPRRKLGKKKAKRIDRWKQKWSGAVRGAVRDTVYGIDLFARKGGIILYVQMRQQLGDLFTLCYLKARVRGQMPPNPRPKRRDLVGRLYSYCFFMLDEDSQPCAPVEGDAQPDWKEPISLTGIRYGLARNKLKKAIKRVRIQINKWLVIERLKPPLKQYRRWSTAARRALRDLSRASDAFLADDSRANWRAMGAALQDIHDIVDAARPPGLYSRFIADWARPGGNETGLRVRERPYCRWCDLPRREGLVADDLPLDAPFIDPYPPDEDEEPQWATPPPIQSLPQRRARPPDDW